MLNIENLLRSASNQCLASYLHIILKALRLIVWIIQNYKEHNFFNSINNGGGLKMVTLENDQLKVQIKEMGAELSSVIDRKSGFEFIWQADEKYWGRHAPVLFPIVGRLKENKYEYMGKTYEMRQHGFARDSVFELEEKNANSAVFSLEYTEETLKMYPFKFKLLVKYLLHESSLTVNYEVINLSTSEVMYYSIGGHPGFNVAQSEDYEGNLEFADLSIEILPDRGYKLVPISSDGLVQLHKPQQVRGDRQQITHDFFEDDGSIYELLNQSEIVLRDEKASVEIRMKPHRMEYLGMWSPSPERAGFICLEALTGFADTEKSAGKLQEKDGITYLDVDEKMTHEYTINFLKETKIQSIRRWNKN